jgi:hypothetical protein
MPSQEFTVVCGQGVADVLQEVDRLVKAAHEWINSDDCLCIYKAQMTRALWNELHDRITDMELSFYRNFLKLVRSGAVSGEIRLVWDSERSLLMYEPKSTLTVGLIPHHYYVNGEKTPILTWSMNS